MSDKEEFKTIQIRITDSLLARMDSKVKTNRSEFIRELITNYLDSTPAGVDSRMEKDIIIDILKDYKYNLVDYIRDGEQLSDQMIFGIKAGLSKLGKNAINGEGIQKIVKEIFNDERAKRIS